MRSARNRNPISPRRDEPQIAQADALLLGEAATARYYERASDTE